MDTRRLFDTRSAVPRRWAVRLAWGALVLLLLVVLGPRNVFGPEAPAPRVAPPANLLELDGWLAHSEAAYPDIRPGTAKGVVWHGAVGQRTPWAVVYLHGFSSSRLELSPLPDLVARHLGANQFYTRLVGNGRTGAAMGEATVQDWLADAVEAVRIGRQLGHKVLVIGTSTGGTLGTWLAMRPEGDGVSAYVLVSPNFGPKDKRSELINGPWGQQLALALEGEMRGEVSADPQEAQGWTGRYATRALFPMMALVERVRESELSRFKTPVLVLYSQRDQTVDPAEIEAAFARIGSSNKTLEAVTYSESVGQHILAGDIRAPKATAPMVERINRWLDALPTRPF
jgi:esterase/lipase